MANKAATRIAPTEVGMAGRRSVSFRMFGDAGVDNVADLGSWISVESAYWKGFQIYPLDQDAVPGVIGSTIVIEGAMELDDESLPFSDAVPALIGTLDNSTRHIATETPYRWVRARVTGFANDPVHVGLLAFA